MAPPECSPFKKGKIVAKVRRVIRKTAETHAHWLSLDPMSTREQELWAFTLSLWSVSTWGLTACNHSHTQLCVHRMCVCLLLGEPAGSILQGCNQGRLCNQYHHSGLENVLRAHSTLRSQRKRKGGWKKIQHERKQMQEGQCKWL